MVGYFFRFPRTKRKPPRLCLRGLACSVFSAGVFRNSRPLS